MLDIGPEWEQIFLKGDIFLKPILDGLQKEAFVTPPPTQMFRFTRFCAPRDIKVVLVGQDPYPTAGHADGLAFSCDKPYLPPSLRAIFQELKASGLGTRTNGLLDDWASQGVLLINMSMTTRINQVQAHSNWHPFTMHLIGGVIHSIHNRTKGHELVIILLGKVAQQIKSWIGDKPGVHFLLAAHPNFVKNGRSVLIGSNVFKTCNEILGDSRAIKWA